MAWNCECIAPKRPPPPTAERTTSGTGPCSFEMYQNLADWLTRLSIGSAMKSPNITSNTGPQPGDGGPEGRSGQGELGDRRVEDALVAEALVQLRAWP